MKADATLPVETLCTLCDAPGARKALDAAMNAARAGDPYAACLIRLNGPNWVLVNDGDIILVTASTTIGTVAV